MAITPPRRARIEMRDRLDVLDLQREARGLATALGFSPQRTAEAVVVVTELATNILRHSRGGAVSLEASATPAGLRVLASDQGPLIQDFRQALQDGSGPTGPIIASETDSPFGGATGLGAVSRWSDRLRHTCNADGGNDIEALLRPSAIGAAPASHR